jgi:copper(I)-binding protein
MKNRLSLAAAVLLAAAVAVSPVLAHDYALGAIQIGNPWSRATPSSAPTAGGYMTLTNKGTEPDRLIAVESEAAGRVELHQMTMDGAIMRMRQLENGVALAPGATVELKPGGNHVMFMQLKAPLKKGEHVPIVLVFEKAGRIAVDMQVEALGAAGPGAPGH